MGLKDRLIGTKEARAAHANARKNLHEVSKREKREETDEFLAANQAVIDAEGALPKWRRGPSTVSNSA